MCKYVCGYVLRMSVCTCVFSSLYCASLCVYVLIELLCFAGHMSGRRSVMWPTRILLIIQWIPDPGVKAEETGARWTGLAGGIQVRLKIKILFSQIFVFQFETQICNFQFHFQYICRSLDPGHTGEISEEKFRKIMRNKEGVPDEDIEEMIEGGKL